MNFTEIHVKWSVILADRLGPVTNKGTSFSSCAFTHKGSWLVNWKIIYVSSRLNEISGGRGKMCLVSGSLPRILKFLRMTFLTARFCGWWVRVNGILLFSSFSDVFRAVCSVDFLGEMFACGYSRVRVAAFFGKLAHFLAFVVVVGVFATEAP